MSRQKLGPTTPRQAAIAAGVGAVLGFFLISLFDLVQGYAPVVPWSLPGIVLLLAVGVWIYARYFPKRLEEGRVSSEEGFGAIVVAKSVIMTGAVLAGGHAVYVAWYLPQLGAPQPLTRVIVGSTTIIVSLLLAWAGYILERACTVDTGSSEDDEGEGAPQSAK